MKKANMTIRSRNGAIIYITCDLDDRVPVLDEVRNLFQDFIHDGDVVESIHFWEEKAPE